MGAPHTRSYEGRTPPIPRGVDRHQARRDGALARLRRGIVRQARLAARGAERPHDPAPRRGPRFWCLGHAPCGLVPLDAASDRRPATPPTARPRRRSRRLRRPFRSGRAPPRRRRRHSADLRGARRGGLRRRPALRWGRERRGALARGTRALRAVDVCQRPGEPLAGHQPAHGPPVDEHDPALPGRGGAGGRGGGRSRWGAPPRGGESGATQGAGARRRAGALGARGGGEPRRGGPAGAPRDAPRGAAGRALRGAARRVPRRACNVDFGDAEALRAVVIPADPPSALATAAATSMYLGRIRRPPRTTRCSR